MARGLMRHSPEGVSRYTTPFGVRQLSAALVGNIGVKRSKTARHWLRVSVPYIAGPSQSFKACAVSSGVMGNMGNRADMLDLQNCNITYKREITVLQGQSKFWGNPWGILIFRRNYLICKRKVTI